MRNLVRAIAMMALCRAALGASTAFGGVVNFEDLGLAPNSFNNSSGGFVSQGASFNNLFTDFGGFTAWSGWSYSNISNSVDPSFANQYAARPGSGFGSVTYGVGFAFSPNDAWINLPSQSQAVSIRIANTTYAYFTMLNGDQFGFSRKFGGADGNTPDFLKLTITGYDGLGATGANVGSVDIYLADYRFGNNALDYIADDWRLADLSGLTGARSLGFAFESSDVDPVFGINTPTYFAADDLITTTLAAAPEPSSWVLSGLAILALAGWGRRRTFDASGSSKLTAD